MRQIASNLRDAEKCLALTQQKGGGRYAPVYLPNLAQLKALNAPSSPPPNPHPTLDASDQHSTSIESDASASEHQTQLSAHAAYATGALQHMHEDSPLDMMPAPQNITVSIGGRRDLEGRARPALPPTDPTAAAVAHSLARGGLADTSTSMEMVRKQVKNLPELSDGCGALFLFSPHAFLCLP